MKKLWLVLLLNLFVVSAASANVWINEIHYENLGGDTGEFFEIAGVAGTDLSSYKVLLVNGSGGAVYNTISLSGTIDNEINGYGALAFNPPTIQNGPPDGIALFGPSDALIQFLSYEGSFTGNGGLIDGLISTDIGVFQANNTPVGSSLQLTGIGSQFADFTFTGPLSASAGSLNVGQTIMAVPEPHSFAMLLAGLGLLGWSVRRQA